MLRAVIFDLHGTLLDDEALRLRLLQERCAAHDVPFDEASYPARFAGLDDRTTFRLLWSEAQRPLPPDELRRLLAEKSRGYAAALAEEVPLFPGARSLFEEASRRLPVGVVAGSLRADAQAALKGAGFFRRCSALVTAEELSRPTPSPEGYAACIAALDEVARRYGGEVITPRSVLVFEDTEAGIHAAQRAGCKVAAVAHTQRLDRLAAAESHAARLIDLDLAGLEKELF